MVSVCVATHDGEKYIKSQLISILEQLDKNDEIIISDDGSSDNTINEIRSLHDRRIKLYQMNHALIGKRPHYYVTKNFENALEYAKGDYIFLSDQDDVWMSNKVQYCIEVLQTCDLVVSNMECVDSEMNLLNKKIYNSEFHFHNYLMRNGKYYGCSLAFKRKVLNYVLPFPEKLLLHDFWIGFLVECLGEVRYVDVSLAKYRVHADNTSATQRDKNTLLFKIKYRLYTMWLIWLRIISYKYRK